VENQDNAEKYQGIIMRIGVTGNYASGKGTVCSMFTELGAIEIDTDIIAREIVQPGTETLKRITDAFGPEFINSDGTLKRREFGKFVFADEERVLVLNGITHPEIARRIIELSPEADGKIYMINAPVLFEAHLEEYMDLVILVSASHEQSVQRGSRRDGLDSNEIEMRLSRQISFNEKKKKSDYVIDNSGDLNYTRKQVNVIWNSIIPRINIP
jgi:dephospho-CoA kinase